MGCYKIQAQYLIDCIQYAINEVAENISKQLMQDNKFCNDIIYVEKD